MSKFVDRDREQAFPLPPGLGDLIPGDDPVHVVIEAVERVDMGAFEVNRRFPWRLLRQIAGGLGPRTGLE